MLEGQAIGAQVFLTRDNRVLDDTTLTGPAMAVMRPKMLADILVAAGVQPLFGGTCCGDRCAYTDWPLLAPDTGKWAGLLSIFE